MYLQLSTLPTTDLLNCKNHTPSFTEKSQTMIDFLQSTGIHKPTWADCRQLLTFFNTEEHQCVTQAALKWLEEHAPEETLNMQTYTQDQFPEEDPHETPTMTGDFRC